MGKFRQLSHVYYKCEYHVVFVPKYRFRVLTGTMKVQVEQDLLSISQWKEVEVLEQNVQADHVHLVCSIPPKISVSDFMGLLKGKLAMRIFQSYPNMKQNPYWGNHFWAKGYFISTIGLDEEMIRRYVRHQEKKNEIGTSVNVYPPLRGN